MEFHKELKISYALSNSGFVINPGFGDTEYSVSYPSGAFLRLSEESRKAIAENFTYSRTRPLAVISDALVYDFDEPVIKDFVDYGVLEDIPRISEYLKKNTDELIKKVKDGSGVEIKFTGKSKNKLIPETTSSDKKVLLALSFGKDSLLCYGLIKEIGLDHKIAFIREMEGQNSGEYKFKNEILEEFSKEEGEEVIFFGDTVDEIYFAKETDGLGEFENTNGMVAFALELAPIATEHGTKYVVFGNEKNLDDSYINEYGHKAYPSFDQSSIYAERANVALQELTDGNLQMTSFVEPIYNIAEMRILFNRYPRLLKYVMSCSPEVGSKSRWCYSCPMCAKSYLYSLAVGGDPKAIAFDESMFSIEKSELYPLFAKSIKRPYEKPVEVRDEQLLAFLLAERNGASGELIDIFREKYSDEAVRREKELRQKFFGIHGAPNLPARFRDKIFSIFEEELKPLYE